MLFKIEPPRADTKQQPVRQGVGREFGRLTQRGREFGRLTQRQTPTFIRGGAR